MTTWFTSDSHFNHSNIIRYCERPFKDIEEMNQVLMDNIAKDISNGDTIYYLGDLSWDREWAEKFFDVVSKCNVIFIKGNHDNGIENVLNKRCKNRVFHIRFVNMKESDKSNGQPLILCHYPLRSWPGMYKDNNPSRINVHGHSHAKLSPLMYNQIDVGVDGNNFRMYSYEQLMKKISEQNQLIEQQNPQA